MDRNAIAGLERSLKIYEDEEWKVFDLYRNLGLPGKDKLGRCLACKVFVPR